MRVADWIAAQAPSEENAWVKKLGDVTMEEAWAQCKDPIWMLDIVQHQKDVDMAPVIFWLIDCCEHALLRVPSESIAPSTRAALGAARSVAEGKPLLPDFSDLAKRSWLVGRQHRDGSAGAYTAYAASITLSCAKDFPEVNRQKIRGALWNIYLMGNTEVEVAVEEAWQAERLRFYFPHFPKCGGSER